MATTRSAAKNRLRALGAEPVIVDALDPDSVAEAVAKAEPEVIVHQLTALSGPMDMRHVKRMVAATNRLRTEGTDHLLAAGRAVGVRTFVAQSYAAWLERTGRAGRRRPRPTGSSRTRPRTLREAVAALRHLEEAVTGIAWAEGIVLRYGGFYGPGTGIEAAPDAVMAELIRKRRFPIVGGGGGVWSLVHIDAAAATAVAAIERGNARDLPRRRRRAGAGARTGCRSWPAALGAKPPRRVPAWLVRLLAGEARGGHDDARSAGSPARRPNANWAGRCGTRAGGRVSPRD